MSGYPSAPAETPLPLINPMITRLFTTPSGLFPHPAIPGMGNGLPLGGPAQPAPVPALPAGASLMAPVPAPTAPAVHHAAHHASAHGLPMPPPAEPWEAWMPGVGMAENSGSYSTATGDHGGLYQPTAAMRAAFEKANPQFSGVSPADPAYQNAFAQWNAHQIIGQDPSAANSPAEFRGDWVFGPAGMADINKAGPNGNPAAVLKADQPADYAGNKALVSGSPTVAALRAKLRAQALQKPSPNAPEANPQIADVTAPGSPAQGATPAQTAAAHAASVAQASQPAQGAQPQAGQSSIASIKGMEGAFPAAPNLKAPGGLAYNPLWAFGAGMLNSPWQDSAAQGIGAGAQALQKTLQARAAYKNNLRQTMFNDAMERPKAAVSLAEATAPQHVGTQPLVGPNGQLLYPMQNRFGQMTYVAAPAGTKTAPLMEFAEKPTQAGETAAQTAAQKAAQGDWQTDVSDLAPATDMLTSVRTLQATIPKSAALFNQQTLRGQVTNFLFTHGILPSSMVDQSTGTLAKQYLHAIQVGDIGKLKKAGGFRYMAGPEIKSVNKAVIGQDLTASDVQNILKAYENSALRRIAMAKWAREHPEDTYRSGDAWKGQEQDYLNRLLHDQNIGEIDPTTGNPWVKEGINPTAAAGVPAGATAQPAAPAAVATHPAVAAAQARAKARTSKGALPQDKVNKYFQ